MTSYSGTVYSNYPKIDVIGDVHGCLNTLASLLETLGYAVFRENDVITAALHTEGRRVCFVGDFTDRGKYSYESLKSAMNLCSDAGGGHYAVMGNHDYFVYEYLCGRSRRTLSGDMNMPDVDVVEAIDKLSQDDQQQILDFLTQLPLEIVFSGPEELEVCHAGTPYVINPDPLTASDRDDFVWGPSTQYQRRDVRNMSYQSPEQWPPVSQWPMWMQGWADRTEGPWCVSGHTPLVYPIVKGRLAMIDTGAVFGTGMTAFRWPEATVVTQPTNTLDNT